MKRILGVALAVAFGITGAALAQTETKTHSETTTKSKGEGKTIKTKTESVKGTVKEYEAGKKIVITGPKDKNYSFDLDENAKVEGTISAGSMAKVQYRKDADGKEKVTVISEAKAREHKHKSMSEPAQASKTSEPKAPAGGTMEMEATTKHKGPGPDTKTSTKMVVGTVKEYEAGKKIVVTGPKNKDYSFDLDENAGVTGDIAVGGRVKVTYTKTDSGQKVTTVAPYTAKKKTMRKAA
jgi:uncharacterized protein YndB with AHSA1/START domain